MKKDSILFTLPFPPPYAGPEIMSNELKCSISKKLKGVKFLNSTIQAQNQKKGKLTLIGLLLFSRLILRYIFAQFNINMNWTNLSSNKIGFIKDSFLIIISKIFGNKIYLHYQGDTFLLFYHRSNNIFKKYIYHVLRISECIVVARENYKYNFTKISDKFNLSVLSNGFSVDKFRINKCKVTQDQVVIFFLGHVSYHKGFYHLIRAYKKLFEVFGEKIALHFAGEYIKPKKGITNFLSGFHKSYYLKNQSQIHNEIEGFIYSAEQYNAKYLGVINFEEKISALNNSDIYCSPSYTESFGNTIVEAMFMQLPVVSTEVGIFPHILIDVDVGYAVDFGNCEQIQEKLSLLINNPNDRLSKGKNARVYCINNFNIEDVTNNLIKLLNSSG